MAAEFKPGVLTNKGLALLAKWQLGRATPTITRAVIGSGSYSASESLTGRTALKSQKLSVGISTKYIQNNVTVLLKCVFGNSTLTAGFKITEIGVYAQDPDEGEILYSIAVSADESNADYLPAYNGTYPSTVVFNYQIEVANAGAVTIKAGTGAYAPADDFNELSENVETLIIKTADNELAIRQAIVSLLQDERKIAELKQNLADDVETLTVKTANNELAIRQTIVSLLQDERKIAEQEQEHEKLVNAVFSTETGTVVLTNTEEYPFNNSKKTVSIAQTRQTLFYDVETTVTAYSGGLPGSIVVSDKQLNGFKLEFDGSAKSVTVAYKIKEGMKV